MSGPELPTSISPIEDAVACTSRAGSTRRRSSIAACSSRSANNFDALHLLGMLNHQRGKAGRGPPADHRGAQGPSALARRAVQSRAGAARAQARRRGARQHRQGAGARARSSRRAQQPRQRAARAQAPGRSGRRVRPGARARAAPCPGSHQPRQCAVRSSAVARRRSPTTTRRWRCSRAIRTRSTTAATRCGRSAARPTPSRPTTARCRRCRAIVASWINRGLALAALNRHGEALDAYRKALALAAGQRRRAFQRGAVAAHRRRLPARLRGIRVALEAHRHGCASRGFASAPWLGEVSAGGQDHPAARRAGLGRHHPVRALRAAAGARRRQGRARGAAGAQGTARGLRRRGIGDRPRRAAAAVRPALPAGEPAAGAARPSCRTCRPRFRICARASRASRAGASASRRCRRRASRSPGRAAPTTSTTATARSRLAQLEPLLATRGVSFVSIQRELRPADAEQLAANTGMLHVGGELADFADTAAVLALCDLAICVDTSVAHLAGAMGRPTYRADAVPAGLALDGRSRAQPLVSAGAAVPAAGSRRLEQCPEARERSACFAGLACYISDTDWRGVEQPGSSSGS